MILAFRLFFLGCLMLKFLRDAFNDKTWHAAQTLHTNSWGEENKDDFRALIEQISSPYFLNRRAKGEYGCTPLSSAIGIDDRAILELLVKKGVDITLPVGGSFGDKNETPLKRAARYWRPNALDVLIEAGAHLIKDKNGFPAGGEILHFAAQNGSWMAFEKLLAAGVDPDARIDHKAAGETYGATPRRTLGKMIETYSNFTYPELDDDLMLQNLKYMAGVLAKRDQALKAAVSAAPPPAAAPSAPPKVVRLKIPTA